MRVHRETELPDENSALLAVETALGQMLARPRDLGPFVVLQDVASGQFVQWCGSSNSPFLFDVPSAGIQGEPVSSPPKAAAERELEVLRQLAQLSGHPFAGFLLEEADTWDESSTDPNRPRPEPRA